MMILAIDGVLGKVFQHVVHPAHIPFQAEAQAAEVRRPRNHGPGRGLLGDGQDAGMILVGQFVEAPDEFDGFQVFVAPERVGHPFAGLRE